MTRQFTATRKDIEAVDEAFVERTAAQGLCFACRQPTVPLRKKSSNLFATNIKRDMRNAYGACTNPDCFMQTDVKMLETWEISTVDV